MWLWNLNCRQRLLDGKSGMLVAEVPFLGAVAGYLAGLTIQISRGAGFLGKEGRLEPLAYLSLSAKSIQLDLPASMQ